MDIDQIKNILIVDDNSAMLCLCTEIFEIMGFHVKLANNAEEAWSIFLSMPSQFDYILTDNDMPQTTGIELIARLRNHGYELPLILMSGGVPPDILDDILDKNTHFLAKPFCMSKLNEIFSN